MEEYKYLVEVVYEEVIVEDNGTPDMRQSTKLSTQVFTFAGQNKSVAKQDADRFFDKTLRYGLTRKGGSIIKSLVPAHCIKNIGMVDFNLYTEEMLKEIPPTDQQEQLPTEESAQIDETAYEVVAEPR